MAKMNPPLRMKKVITGYHSLRAVKSSTEQYTVQTNAGATEADVSDSDGVIVGSVTGDNLNDLMQKVREGLIGLGVKFPILTAANIPFGDFEVQGVDFTNTPNTGSFRLVYSGSQTTLLAFNVSAPQMQAALRLIAGLEAISVAGSVGTGFDVSFIGVPGDLSLMTTANNTLNIAAVAATGSATITNFANLLTTTPDTITVAGVVFTAQAGAATPGTATFQAATSNDATASSLATQINAHATSGPLVTATANLAVCSIVADTAGTGGNSLSLLYTDNGAEIGATVTGSGTLSGGVAVQNTTINITEVSPGS